MFTLYRRIFVRVLRSSIVFTRKPPRVFYAKYIHIYSLGSSHVTYSTFHVICRGPTPCGNRNYCEKRLRPGGKDAVSC